MSVYISELTLLVLIKYIIFGVNVNSYWNVKTSYCNTSELPNLYIRSFKYM